MNFNLNGTVVTVPNDWSDYRLLWVLRDHFKLTGPKFGCGIGVCGACCVHVDGNVERSCSLTVSDIENSDLVTLEGLAPPDDLHPVQEAWIKDNVPQCGYCQNGQVMTAAALLAATPPLTEAEITEQMSGVRCRCGTQPRIKKALRQAQLKMGGSK
ncbi:(2Fe-2S)-binding protein [Sneathiella sp.]|jgi:isoquinoline 1-oxidoreductase alpha subunit|uniref:(2Fe-2S)-binding protein n=1 Tax=Sneathiella sp. TaxID=1964365 RepID=UPI0039E5B281